MGGIIRLSSFETCLCSKPGTCGLSNDQLPTPIQGPCESGYRHGPPDEEEDGPDPEEDAGATPEEDAGTDAQSDAPASCTCPTYNEFRQRIDGPMYRGPSCFTAEGNPTPWSGTCRPNCTCTLIGEALATWTSADEGGKAGVVTWACGWEEASWEELAERAVWSCD